MCGIDVVLLLLLLTFRDTLLSYSLVLIRTITAPGIPVRRNRTAKEIKGTEKTLKASFSKKSNTFTEKKPLGDSFGEV